MVRTGHALRLALRTPMFDGIAMAYNSPAVRKLVTWAVGSALAGSTVSEPVSGASYG